MALHHMYTCKCGMLLTPWNFNRLLQVWTWDEGGLPQGLSLPSLPACIISRSCELHASPFPCFPAVLASLSSAPRVVSMISRHGCSSCLFLPALSTMPVRLMTRKLAQYWINLQHLYFTVYIPAKALEFFVKFTNVGPFFNFTNVMPCFMENKFASWKSSIGFEKCSGAKFEKKKKCMQERNCDRTCTTFLWQREMPYTKSYLVWAGFFQCNS